MSRSVNKITLIGNVGRDPDIHQNVGTDAALEDFGLEQEAAKRDDEVAFRYVDVPERVAIAVFVDELDKVCGTESMTTPEWAGVGKR